VALEGKGLKLKDFFTPAKSAFTTGPVLFLYQGKEVLAVANKDGRIYLLDGASPGGADHRTPLAQSTPFGNVSTGALATWQEGGTRWILAPVAGSVNSAAGFSATNGNIANGAIAAFKVVDQAGRPSLQPAWVSRDLTFPLTPAIVNGVVFAVSGGDDRHPAVVYALDGSTGKDLWNSGATITSYARSGISGGSSQLYLGTYDSLIYAFGFPLVK
jgi:outer membrane protein assembly factor BamB